MIKMQLPVIQQVKGLRTYIQFMEHFASLGILNLPVDPKIVSAANNSPMAEPYRLGDFTIGNRWCIQPMEGWDGTEDGRPSEHTLRRWKRFGESGAKLIWGGEAYAVQYDGRANPNQLFLQDDKTTIESLTALRSALLEGHFSKGNSLDDILIGLQLTHSGRFARPDPDKKLKPKILYHHSLLDEKFGISHDDNTVILSDKEIEGIIDNYVRLAVLAQDTGFHFVDLKHCHGYLGHEFLSAYDRKGKYGGPELEDRTRFLKTLIDRIQDAAPKLKIGVRLSLYDKLPFIPDPEKRDTIRGKLGPGIPMGWDGAALYPGFGLDRKNPLEMDLTEPIALIKLMKKWGVSIVNLSAGSPYYNPHFQRSAITPPSDGYSPHEDPLISCNEQIQAAFKVKNAVPSMAIVGTNYTYFQEFLPNVAQATVRKNMVDFVGIGRMVLSYPHIIHDTLTDGEINNPELICRTLSDCTTAPRNGIISGCFPFDNYYRSMEPEFQNLKDAKSRQRRILQKV
jgi:NADPH2 dehydrogenase